VSHKKISKKFCDGTNMTILSAISDGNSAVVEYTLEKKGGVDCLVYDNLTNEGKGAYFSEDSRMYYDFIEYNGCTYVDMGKSTKDLLYCYEYMTGRSEKIENEITLHTEEYPCSFKEFYSFESDYDKFEELKAKRKDEDITIPIIQEVGRDIYVCDGGGSIEISPLSLKIDLNMGLGLTQEEAYSPDSLYFIKVVYKDGSVYQISEKDDYKGRHSCKNETSNYAYCCGDNDNHTTFVFNRLVDTDNIEHIQVNETIYSYNS